MVFSLRKLFSLQDFVPNDRLTCIIMIFPSKFNNEKEGLQVLLHKISYHYSPIFESSIGSLFEAVIKIQGTTLHLLLAGICSQTLSPISTGIFMAEFRSI